jgi:hypothetical protein
MGQQTGHSGFPIGASHRRNRNPAIVINGKEGFHDSGPDIPRCPSSRLQMHPQSRTGIHFDNPALLAAQRPLNMNSHQIDPSNIKPHDPGSCNG